MSKNSIESVLILGAGPAGLSAGWNLAQDGRKVLVLEKEKYHGGQSATFARGGYRYDLGPHNIHSVHRDIIAFLKSALGDSFRRYNLHSAIYFRGRRVKYPLLGIDVLQSVNLLTAFLCALSFFQARFQLALFGDRRDDGSYEKWIINRFGRRMYDIFFAPYTEKVWKIKPSRISDHVAKKRIVTASVMEVIKAVLFKIQRHHPENPNTIENYYPVWGAGMISDYFAGGIKERGGVIRYNCEVKKITIRKGKISSVTYEEDGALKEAEADKIISTLPLNSLVMMTESDEDIKGYHEAAKNIDFTSEVLLYMVINKPSAFNVPLFYFSEPEFPFNRAYDVGLFSPEMVKKGTTLLCFEISCNYNDSVWNEDKDALFERCIRVLEKRNLLKKEHVEDYFVQRVKHAYPRFRIGYESHLRKMFSYIESVRNLITCGRQGLFSYANIDDVIWMGFEIAKNIENHERLKLSHKELMPQYINI